MVRTRTIAAAGLAVAAAFAPAAQACSVCGCTLNSDWSTQGYSPHAGLHLQLRYDYFDADQLRTGTKALDTSDPANQPGPNQANELQHRTRNRVANLTLDYSVNSDWGVSVMLPWVDRFHTTYAAGDTDLSTSNASGIGDLRTIGRYQGFSEDRSYGVLFGVKWATGRHDQTFSQGPASLQAPPDNLLDRGLQLGSGTTDVILGAYKFGALSRDWDYFTQGFVQHALNAKDDFKPGDSINVNAGVRYMGFETIRPMLQLNWRSEKRETGAEADTDNSGLTLVNLTPGVTASVTKHLDVFGFVALPIYQNVRGIQLVQRYTVSVGAAYAF